MSEPGNNCATRLLGDVPTRDDAFGHAKVADAIAGLVTTERGGRCIGLAGSWGSGKSSVVELLREKLRHLGQGEIDVFIFDAWSHQGDPLRRTFLEQLIDRLLELGWLKSPDSWKDTKEKLAKRLEVIQTTSEPILTALGAAFAVSLLLVPFGYQLAKYVPPTEPNYLYWAIAGLATVSLPFMLVAITWLCWRPCWAFWTKPFWTTHRRPYQKRSLLALFLNKSQERVTSNAVRTPDPTSVEFQSIFGQAIREALTNQHRRLLLVVDNLDRVDAHDALAIWATLKAFFDFDSRSEPSTFERLWLLVPFDEPAIRKLWAGRDDSPGGLAQSFLDKTFQVIFRVSPPVLSDWQAFINAQLLEAFPSHKAAEFHRIYRLYDLLVVGGKEPPTPRDIKLFINRVGAIHRQWQDQISLPVQALYAILSRRDRTLGEDLALLKDEEILGNVPVDMAGPDWREALAAIHFNVPKERALQVMVGGRIKNTIASGDGEQLERLSSIPGFTVVLERQIEEYRQNWTAGETRSLGLLTSNLAKLTAIDDSSWTRSWDLLRDATKSAKQWSNFDSRVADGLVQTLKRSPDNAIATSVLKSVSASFPDDTNPAKQPGPAQIRPWLDGAALVLRFLLENHATLIESTFRIRGSASTYVRTMVVAAGETEFKDIYRYLRPQAELADVVEELSGIVGEGNFDGTHTAAIASMKLSGEAWPWVNLVGALGDRLQSADALQAAELTTALSTLIDFADTLQQAKDALSKAVSNGDLARHLSSVSKDPRATALCMATLLEVTSDGVVVSASNPTVSAGMAMLNTILDTSDKRQNTISEFTNFLTEHRKVEILYRLPDAQTSSPFITTVFKRLASMDDAYKNIPPNEIIERREFFEKILGSDGFSTLVQQSVANANLTGSLSAEPFDLERVGIYGLALRAGGRDQSFLEFLAEGLRSLNKATWLSQIEGEGEALNLLLATSEAGQELQLKSAFEEALLDHAQQLVDGTAELGDLKDSWNGIVDTMDKNFQITMLRTMIDTLCDSEEPTDALLELYGDRLAGEDVLSDTEDRVARLAFPRFLQRLRVLELHWISKVLEKNPNFLGQVKPETRAVFEDRLVDASEQQAIGEEVGAAVSRVAYLARVDLQKLKEKRESAAQNAGVGDRAAPKAEGNGSGAE